MIKTPSYVFDIGALQERVAFIKASVGAIPLTYSIKSNSFILPYIVDLVSHVEVCSPGELDICIMQKIPPEKIIYSGVMKEYEDVRKAISYGVDIITAESPSHLAIINSVAAEKNLIPKIILRISSGNQFGMDRNDICAIIRDRSRFDSVFFYGYHYYSGTQKKKTKDIDTDLTALSELIDFTKQEYGFVPTLVEYGPGLATEYFKADAEAIDRKLLEDNCELLLRFSEKYPLGIEMGRFIAAPCGKYYTSVKDIKTTAGTNYVILDGGTHHLKYHGQMMAMNTPIIHQFSQRGTETRDYCLCGSLCTTADLFARKAALYPLDPGDVLEFDKCGAYSISEASALFLSRDLPAVYIRECDGSIRIVRDALKTSEINSFPV